MVLDGGLRGSILDEPRFFTLVEGGALFALALWRLRALYPGAYARGSTSTIGPPGPDYEGGGEVEARGHIDIIPLLQAP